MRTRREFLWRCAAGAAGAAMLPRLGSSPALYGAERVPASPSLRVDAIHRTTVRVPYREIPQRAMDRELPHWRYSEVFRVRLASGQTGFGETLLYYTWGVSEDDDVRRALGRNAADLLWDDSLGAGLQMALFDATARTLGVPVHRLLGKQVHERTPLSWWNIDMPPEDMAAECAEAHRQGYLSYKTKGRPWFDLWEQVAQSSRVVPEWFKIDMDFNDTLLDADRAIPILKELEATPQIDIYETPIPQSDVEGNRRIREATRVSIALHYGTPSPDVVVREGVCDGFVVGGGATRLLEQGRFCGEVGMPFWLQLVGTGITAAFSLHFGAVLKEARWPAVNCHQLYTETMLDRPIVVEKGFAQVPDQPGLGFELDLDAVDRLRVQKPESRPEPPRLLEIAWPDGRRMDVADDGEVNFLLRPAMKPGPMPYFEHGVTTRVIPNDGSAIWRERRERARKGLVLRR